MDISAKGGSCREGLRYHWVKKKDLGNERNTKYIKWFQTLYIRLFE